MFTSFLKVQAHRHFQSRFQWIPYGHRLVHQLLRDLLVLHRGVKTTDSADFTDIRIMF